jgi:hypothetical protein
MSMKSRLVECFVTGAVLLQPLRPQPSASVAEKLSQRYALTRVDPDGNVTHAGSTVTVGRFLLRANPIYSDRYQPNTYKKGRVSQPTLMKPSRDNIKLADSLGYIRFHETVYITGIEVNDAEIVFKLQTRGAFVGRPLADAIYRASLSFQFQKGFMTLSNLDSIENTIGEVLTIVEPGGTSEPPQSPPTQLMGMFINSANTEEQLQLHADGSFSLRQGGPAYTGRFSVRDAKLVLVFSHNGVSSIAKVQDGQILDDEGKTWVYKGATEDPPSRKPSAPDGSRAQEIVHAGQTVDEVTALLGQPEKIENLGGKMIYVYAGLKVTFLDGRVVEVQ